MRAEHQTKEKREKDRSDQSSVDGTNINTRALLPVASVAIHTDFLTSLR
jgi:hypothetical protein